MARRRRKGKGSRTAQPNVMHPDAAGLDLGSTEVYAAVSPERDPDPIRNFPTFTADLHALADWLKQCQVTTVAMESTGVYWIPVPGSHGTLYAGARRTTVKDRKKEIGKGLLNKMLADLGIDREDF